MSLGIIWAVAGLFGVAFALNFVTMLISAIVFWPQAFTRGEVSSQKCRSTSTLTNFVHYRAMNILTDYILKLREGIAQSVVCLTA